MKVDSTLDKANIEVLYFLTKTYILLINELEETVSLLLFGR